MDKKFKLPPPSAKSEPIPASSEAFSNGATMVQSQQPSRPLAPVRLNLDLSVEIHEQVRRRATDLRMSIAQYVRELIRKDLQERILE